MATTQQIQAAIQNAQAAGDTEAVQRLSAALPRAEDAPSAAAQGQQPSQPGQQQLSDAIYAASDAGDQQAAHRLFTQLRAQGMSLAPRSPTAQEAAFQKLNAQNVAAQPWYQTALQGAGKAFVDTGHGLKQLYDLAADRIDPQQQTLSGLIAGQPAPSRYQQDMQGQAQTNQQDQALMNSGAGKVGYIGGQGAQMLALGGAAGVGLKGAAALGAASPYVASALAGGAFAGAQPVTADQSRGANAALGAGLGAAGEAVPAALGALAGKAAPTIGAAKQAAIATAEKYGIPLHLSQATDSKFLQTLASASKYLPFSGTSGAQAAQSASLNRALASTIGQQADELTPAVMSAAKSANSTGYNDLFARNSVQLDPNTSQRLGALWQQAKQDLTPDQANIVQNQILKYVQAAQDNNGVIPGRLYQNVRAEVQRVEGQNAPAKYLVGQVRKTMQDAANNSFGGQDAAALKALNQQYSNIKILDKALGQAQGANYTVNPANLWRLVNTKYGSSPEMYDLAQMGQAALKDPIPDSGTAGRLLSYGSLLGGAAAPHAVAVPALMGATVGRALNSPLAARVLPYAGQNMLLGLSNAARPAPYMLPLLATQP